MEQKAKSGVRSVRQNGMKVLTNLKKQKASGISADEIKQLEKEVSLSLASLTLPSDGGARCKV